MRQQSSFVTEQYVICGSLIGRQVLMLTLAFLTCLVGRLSVENHFGALKSHRVFLLFCISMFLKELPVPFENLLKKP